MSAITSVADGWENVAHPPSLFRRFVFESYGDTRAFLERLADLSASTGYYPDLGFGKTYVNVTVAAAKDGPTSAQIDFAQRAAALISVAAPPR